MTVYNAKQFGGLVLGIDRRQVAEPSVLDGRNFIVSAKGPKSSFANEFLTYQKLPNGVNVDVFDLDTEFLFFTDSAVYEYFPDSQAFVPRYVLSTPATDNFPWSAAFVGLRWYFTKPGANLIEYDIDNNIWTEVTTDIPTNLTVLTESGGRLVLVGDTEVKWSAIDDGTNLVLDIDAGVGAQVLSIVGNGAVLGVKPFSTGFIVYTETGKLWAEDTNLINPYRFTPIRDKFVPIDQYGITELDQTSHIILTSSGLYLSKDFAIEPIFVTLSEELRQNLFLKVSPRIVGAYRIFFDQERQLFFLSISEQGIIGEYNYAINVYLPIDKPGLFDSPHANIFLLPTTEITSKIDDLGFIDFDDRVKVITDNRQTEFFEKPQFFYHKFTNAEIPFRTEGAVQIFPAGIRMEAFTTVLDTAPDGFYTVQESNSFAEFTDNILLAEVRTISTTFSDDTDFDDDTTFNDVTIFPALIQMGAGFADSAITLYRPGFVLIDSFVELGPFRLLDQEISGRLQEIDRIISGADNVSVLIEIEDLELVSPDQTENLESGALLTTEDLGENDNPFNNNSYRLRIVGTIDGQTVYLDNNEVGEEIAVEGTERIFTCFSQGLYHTVIYEPVVIGDSFLVSTLELTARPGDWIDA